VQQLAPAPRGGGMIKAEWFGRYEQAPERFDRIIQSWDTANKESEFSDYSVCTTWAIKDKAIHLLHVFRKRLNYPDLKRAVCQLASEYRPDTILIEDRSSGTSLIQDLVADGLYGVTKYAPSKDKIMRMHAQTGLIENGLVHIPKAAPWLDDYLHELTTFPNGKHDDQVDSTSQALDWIKQGAGLQSWLEYYERRAAEARGEKLPELPKPAVGIATAPVRRAPEPKRTVVMRTAQPHRSFAPSRGTRYTSDASGLIEGVDEADVEAMRNAGCYVLKPDHSAERTGTPSPNGERRSAGAGAGSGIMLRGKPWQGYFLSGVEPYKADGDGLIEVRHQSHVAALLAMNCKYIEE
jgi:predicted phage terminase large subunit-like protein